MLHWDVCKAVLPIQNYKVEDQFKMSVKHNGVNYLQRLFGNRASAVKITSGNKMEANSKASSKHISSTMYERDKVAINHWLPRQLPPIYQRSAESIWIFTDGACKGNNNVAVNKIPAGWGMVVLKCSGLNELGVSTTVVHESYGPVIINPSNPEYLGAEHGMG